MRILVTGAAGMVGSQLDFGIKTDLPELDILSIESIEKAVGYYCPDVILHLAANTDMEDCEKNPQNAYQLNTFGTFNLVKTCKARSLGMVYLSSGTVFDGGKDVYSELDAPNPLNVYARTKLAGEWIVRNILEKHLIVRTGWLFGGGPKRDKKFVGYCAKRILAGQPVTAVADRFGSPTYIPDLLAAVHNAIFSGKVGIYHIVNAGPASYFDIAKYIKKISGTTANVVAGNSSDSQLNIVKRARSEVLVSNRIFLRSWQEALEEYIKSAF